MRLKANTFAARLAWLRERLHGKRGKRKFAAELGTPPQTYQGYEDSRQPPADFLAKVLNLCRCDADWLLTGEGDPFPERVVDRPVLIVEPHEVKARMEELGETGEQYASLPLLADAAAAGNPRVIEVVVATQQLGEPAALVWDHAQLLGADSVDHGMGSSDGRGVVRA